MDDSTITLQRATPADLHALLKLIAEFYQVDGHSFDERRIQGALVPLLEHDLFGKVYLIGGQEGLPPASVGDPAGYVVVTWGYSLESGGREALIDEIFVRERGIGNGGKALQRLLHQLHTEGIKVVFLETERANDRARKFYQRFGFKADNSIWMSQSLHARLNTQS